MTSMFTVSLFLNILVLVPVCAGLLLRATWIDAAYGPATQARGILLAVYLAILIGSAVLLFRPAPQQVAVLLCLQVVYKLLTPITVGTFRNPVVISNIVIAAIHAVTVSLILGA